MTHYNKRHMHIKMHNMHRKINTKSRVAVTLEENRRGAGLRKGLSNASLMFYFFSWVMSKSVFCHSIS